MPFLAPALAQAQTAAAAALGTARFEAESEAGRRLSRDAALGLALGSPAQPAPPAGTGPLNKPGFGSRAQVAAWMAADQAINQR
jgi:hypothetical protein